MVNLKRFEVIQNNRVIDDAAKHNALYPVAIDFKDLTVIVGPNGSGKTQFLKAILSLVDKDSFSKKDYKTHIDVLPGTRFLMFDEKAYEDRVSNPPPWDTTNYFNAHARLVLRNWQSKGEGQMDLMDSIIPIEGEFQEFEGVVFAFDEPDHNLDFNNQVELFNRLKKLSELSQVIVITHSPVVIAQAGEVFDMETKQWVNSKEYLGRYGI